MLLPPVYIGILCTTSRVTTGNVFFKFKLDRLPVARGRILVKKKKKKKKTKVGMLGARSRRRETPSVFVEPQQQLLQYGTSCSPRARPTPPRRQNRRRRRQRRRTQSRNDEMGDSAAGGSEAHEANGKRPAGWVWHEYAYFF